MADLKKPELGTWVRVKTDYSAYKRYFDQGVRRKHEWVGKVVESQGWESEDSFALLTDDPAMRIKTIELKNVTSIELVETTGLADSGRYDAIASDEKAVDRTFEIKGSKGNTYIVTKDKFSWSCTCQAGQRGRRCKHVAEAQGILKKETA